VRFSLGSACGIVRRLMADPMTMRCRCGALTAAVTNVTPATVNRVVCYCDDCQAFARWLGRDDVLDPHGGTDIVQIAPVHVRFERGAEHLRCMRLTTKGLLRWYADCCRTPIGNTVSARLPLIGVPRLCFDAPDAEARLGPAVGIHGRFAIDAPAGRIHPKVPLAVVLRLVRLVLRWRLTGQGSPSPFFDPATGTPRVEPVLARG
jgi:hypothetical protein